MQSSELQHQFERSTCLASCSCCPYGFHIDRDFVTYCESMYSSSQLSKLKQKRRDRHKFQKTVESYLGIHMGTGNVLTETSVAAPNASVKQMAVIADAPTAPESHPRKVGIDCTVLTGIRELIASSLKRMKELEEQVKSIPLLQVKLAVLTEERRCLLDELKNELETSQKTTGIAYNNGNMEKNMEKSHPACAKISLRKNLNDTTTSNHANLLSTFPPSDFNAFNNQFSMIEKCKYVKDTVPLSITTIHKNVKDAETSCSVLTRDVGTGHVQAEYKSTAVGDESIFSLPLYLGHEQGMSGESFDESGDSVKKGESDFKILPYERSDPRTANLNVFVPCNSVDYVVQEPEFNNVSVPSCDSLQGDFVSFDGNMPLVKLPATVNVKVESKDVSTVTDLKMSDIIFNEYLRQADIPEKTENTSCSSPSSSSNPLQFSFDNFEESDACSASITKHPSIVELSKIQTSSLEIVPHHTIHNSYHPDKNATVDGEQVLSDALCSKCGLQKTSIETNNSYLLNINCRNFQQKEVKSVGVGDSDVSDHTHVHLAKVINATNSITTRSVGTNTSQHSLSFVSDQSSVIKNLQVANHLKDVEAINSSSSEEISGQKISNQESESTLLFASDSVSQVNRDALRCPTAKSSTVVKSGRMHMNKETKAACKILNDFLLKPAEDLKDNMVNSLNLIEEEWFRVANQRNADPYIIEDYLDYFEEYSRLLLHHIVNLADSNGNTALHYAVSYSNFDVVSILLDSKVSDVSKQNKAGYTCIMLAALTELNDDAHRYVVQKLFQSGDINIKATQNGQTALMLAVSHGKTEVIKLLLDAGAEINLQDNDGSTALMCAAEHGHTDIVRLLLSHEACDPCIMDNDGSTALTIAMEAGNKDIGLLIYANMNFSKGNSPFSSLKQRQRITHSGRTTPLQETYSS